MSLTLAEARARAAMLSAVSYDLALDITDPHHFRSRVVARFDTTGGDTFLELHRAESLDVEINGEKVTTAYDGRRIPLDELKPGTHEVVVDARLRYVTDGEGLHTFTDPADGERYIGGYLGLDITQRLFACFDQLDLKAPISLTVTADPAWTVLSNGVPTSDDNGRHTFATTRPIPCDLLVVAAGPFHSVRWEHGGVPMGWHARRSLAAELDRDAAELKAVTEACFNHFARVFTEPFPFDSYDQVFVPELNWGAMECPGCVTFNEFLLPRGRVTDDDRRRRAMVIAHEMSHMWFGDLVSPLWWEDAWLNESFADYMGFEVAETLTGFAGTRVSFEAVHKPGAYLADRRRSTHPVAPEAVDVPDVAIATTIFDQISYGKGNAVLRQLVTWLGEEDFLAGVNAHLTAHRFANATLEDLLSALDAASSRDVRGWAEVWLRRSGHDTIRVTRRDDVPVVTREGVRPHRFTVCAYDQGLNLIGTRMIDLAGEPVPLPEWAGLVVVPNAHGETFARVDLDPFSREALANGLATLPDPLVRAGVWTTLLDGPPPAVQLELLARQLPREPSPTLVTAALGRVRDHLIRRRLTADAVPAALETIASACAGPVEPDEQRAVALARGLAWTTADSDQLRRWLDSGATDHGLTLDPELRWTVVHRLAELGGLDEAGIEAERLRDGTADGVLGSLTALAARPTAEAKASAWAAMTGDPEISVRRFRALADGLWSPAQRGLLTPYIAGYVSAAPALAERGSAFAAVVGRAFPALALTDQELDLVRDALRHNVPAVLRRHWDDELDDRA
ncbi:aminopeptidase [Actinoplanes italicus]|uniref:Aminopeptidase N n=1 Tax=Actinoplanes italicus TaxID=113567 RepID=A0A2T0K1B7_9ACTN|nr:aminopeptidase N [Actinoplanes italicus]PRX16589.1 aminopeptidase N [Actinoplanes italicus]GIE33796.1 aminopeptidase [Actinoplanes italicus]